LREGISGSWYLFAPIMLAGSIFIFFIGFVAVCNLVLVKSNKDLKHTTIELILGASSRFVLAKECVEYGLVCLLSVFLGLQLSQFFSAYLSTLFNQWDEHQMHPYAGFNRITYYCFKTSDRCSEFEQNQQR
jgi:hypothetical protein